MTVKKGVDPEESDPDNTRGLWALTQVLGRQLLDDWDRLAMRQEL